MQPIPLVLASRTQAFRRMDERARARMGPAAELLRLVPNNGWPDGSAADIEGLVAVQGSMMRHYFRLVRAQEDLERRLRRGENRRTAILARMEEERARLAHELHSGAGQALAGIKIHLELIDSFLQNPPEQVRNSLHRIGLLAQEALQQVRATARRVHPPDWEHLGLREALERLWEASGVSGKFEAEISLAQLSTEPPHHVRILLYRVAQEALTNAIRHAEPKHLRLALADHHGSVRLVVEDDGKGFDTAAALTGRTGSHGIGLRSMRDQMRWVGGELLIESGSWGTRLTARVPVRKSS